MKADCVFAGLTLGVAWLTGPSLLAATAPTRETALLARCEAVLADFEGRPKAELEIFRQALTDGVEQGLWTEGDRLAAEALLGNVTITWLGPTAKPTTGADALFLSSMRQAFAPQDADLEEMRKLRLWGQQRFQAINYYRYATLMLADETVLRAAEQLWCTARTPEQLEPAAALLQRWKVECGNRWTRTQQITTPYRPPLPALRVPSGQLGEFWNSNAANDLLGEVVDAWVIGAAPPAFFLPDPIADPKGFAMARATWWGLQSGGNTFVRRPRVQAQFAELDARFLAAADAAHASVVALLARNAPVAELEPAFRTLAALHFVPPQSRSGAFPSSPNPQRREVSNHLAAVRWTPDVQTSFRASLPVTPERLRAFESWVEWRRATEEGVSAKETTARASLLRVREQLPPIAVHLLSTAQVTATDSPRQQIMRLLLEGSEQVKEPADLAALAGRIDALALTGQATTLSSLRRETSNRLQEAARRWKSDPSAAKGRQGGWNLIPGTSWQGAFWQLRHRITERFLSRQGTEGELDTSLREAIEEGFTRRDLTRVTTLLNFAAAFDWLSEAERYRLSSVVATFGYTETWVAEGKLAEARRQFQGILRTPLSPAAERLAVEWVKKLKDRPAE